MEVYLTLASLWLLVLGCCMWGLKDYLYGPYTHTDGFCAFLYRAIPFTFLLAILTGTGAVSINILENL